MSPEEMAALSNSVNAAIDSGKVELEIIVDTSMKAGVVTGVVYGALIKSQVPEQVAHKMALAALFKMLNLG